MTMTPLTDPSSTSGAPASNPHRSHSLANFLALDASIDIVPNFSYKAPLTFLVTQTNVGPFYAGVNTSVPLWMAIYLRKRNRCRIVAPEWMSVDHLKAVLAFESTKDTFSTQLPFHYKEISRTILQTCGAGRSQVHASGGESEELPHAEQIRVLLEDISTVRMDKIRRSVHELSAVNMRSTKPIVIDVTGMGSTEMVTVKPFLERACGDHLRLVKAGSTSSRAVGKGIKGDETEGENVATVAVNRSRIRRFVSFILMYLLVMNDVLIASRSTDDHFRLYLCTILGFDSASIIHVPLFGVGCRLIRQNNFSQSRFLYFIEMTRLICIILVVSFKTYTAHKIQSVQRMCFMANVNFVSIWTISIS